jgi:hypothetical protein
MTVVDELAREVDKLRAQAAKCLGLADNAFDEEVAEHLRLLAADYLDLAGKVEARAMALLDRSAATGY